MKVIRHRLDIYNTVLRLAYDEKSWRALVKDYPGYPALPSNIELDRPPLGHSGMTYANVWEPRSRKRQLGQTVQQVAIVINIASLRRDPAQLAATIAHECVHAAALIFEKISADQPPATAGEPFAYLVDWLVEWVWDNLPNTPI